MPGQSRFNDICLWTSLVAPVGYSECCTFNHTNTPVRGEVVEPGNRHNVRKCPEMSGNVREIEISAPLPQRDNPVMGLLWSFMGMVYCRKAGPG